MFLTAGFRTKGNGTQGHPEIPTNHNELEKYLQLLAGGSDEEMRARSHRWASGRPEFFKLRFALFGALTCSPLILLLAIDFKCISVQNLFIVSIVRYWRGVLSVNY